MELKGENTIGDKILLPNNKAYRIIAPRIAFIVTTVDRKGRVNAGSFSYLTPVSTEPDRLALSVYKEWDTTRNIRATREFVVNVPSKNLLEKVLICADKYVGSPIPPGISELEIAGLTEIPSLVVKPPRIAECYGHLECRVWWIKDVGNQYLVLADIVSSSFTKGYLTADFAVDISVAQPLMEFSKNMFTCPEQVIKGNMQSIKTTIKKALAKMNIRIPQNLRRYEEDMLSEK